MLGSAEQPVSLHMRQHAFLAVAVLLTLSPSLVPVFLELFSGTGGLSAAVERWGGYSLRWDVLHGAEYDLTVAANVVRILAWLRAGLIWGVHCAMECKSWSIARHGEIRSRRHIWGKARLSQVDRRKVEAGNALLRASMSILLACWRFHIPVGFENPHSSICFHAPPMLSFAKRRGVKETYFDMCAFGTPYRKRTRLLHYGCNMTRLMSHRCKSNLKCEGSLCSFTGMAHKVLKFETAEAAKEYPPALNTLLAESYATAYNPRH